MSVGVAAAMPSPHRARWEAFAAQSGLGLVRLGERGWDRVELGERSAILQYVDVPAELAGAGDVVFVQSGQRSPLETWKLIVHPNSAMRALASGDAGLVELALAVDARYITLRSVGTVVLGVDCRDRVASELLSAAVSRLDADAGGVETLGPWEESRVQILAALAGGITLPTQLVIRAFASDTGIAQWIPRLGELIGCRVEWHDEGAHADER
ncbi:MAG TPA: hypothetical protein VMM78_05955 [Thermomicrobiales bacterium]|nr:hypothetical protein [Thermomicrobiales bacterium]